MLAAGGRSGGRAARPAALITRRGPPAGRATVTYLRLPFGDPSSRHAPLPACARALVWLAPGARQAPPGLFGSWGQRPAGPPAHAPPGAQRLKESKANTRPPWYFRPRGAARFPGARARAPGNVPAGAASPALAPPTAQPARGCCWRSGRGRAARPPLPASLSCKNCVCYSSIASKGLARQGLAMGAGSRAGKAPKRVDWVTREIITVDGSVLATAVDDKFNWSRRTATACFPLRPERAPAGISALGLDATLLAAASAPCSWGQSAPWHMRAAQRAQRAQQQRPPRAAAPRPQRRAAGAAGCTPMSRASASALCASGSHAAAATQRCGVVCVHARVCTSVCCACACSFVLSLCMCEHLCLSA